MREIRQSDDREIGYRDCSRRWEEVGMESKRGWLYVHRGLGSEPTNPCICSSQFIAGYDAVALTEGVHTLECMLL